MAKPLPHESSNLCSEVAMYMIDVLSDSKRAAFAIHLEQCRECQQFVDDVESVTENYTFADINVELPAGMKSWVLARQQLRPIHSNQTNRRSCRIIGVLIAVCILLALTTVLATFRINSLHTVIDDVFSSASGYSVEKVVNLHAVKDGVSADGHAVVILDGNGVHFVVQVERLPEPGMDEAYRVWLLKDGTLVDAGMLPTIEGAGALSYNGTSARYEQISISLEPNAVEETPVGQIVLTGNLSWPGQA